MSGQPAIFTLPCCALLLALAPACAATCPETSTAPTSTATAPAPTPTADAATPSDESQEIGEACSGERYREFDFWLGAWEVRDGEGQLAGHNRIERAQGGCVLIEHWQGSQGGSGISINYIDPESGRWVQDWVSSDGTVIQLEGGLAGAAMVLEGRYVTPKPTAARMRGTWTPLDDGRVRQTFEVSKDGETWTTWFDGYYSGE